jgi:hypothetical protein
MGDLETGLIGGATLLGIIYGSFMGYRAAKQQDPSIEWDWGCFMDSVIRSLPAVFAAAGVGAFAGLDVVAMSTFATVLILLTAFLAGTGSDVVLKRSWQAVKKTSGAVTSSTGATIAKTQFRKLMFLALRK